MKSLTLGAAALLLRQCLVQAQIQNDTYFYGQSEPVYPSPQGQGTGQWATAYQQARAFVAQLTIDEKTNLTGGFADTSNGCSGNINPIPRLNFPGLCVTDAGNGVRGTDFVNGYASGIHVGASWNKALTHQRAVDMGGEFRIKGINVQLGPVVGPLGRVSEGGRNWEGFSNDPYLSGKLTAQHIQGLQSNGVGTCTKHFIGNEQELDRNPTISATNQTVESVSSNIDDTTLHELYLWPFVDAVQAGTVSIMCSYNRINNSYGCQNSKSLNGILKTELGFQGFVMSDWFAQHSGVASAQAGMDMVMPSGLAFWGPNLTQAVENGTIPQSRLDDMATRIMATWFLTNQNSGSFPARGIGMPANVLAPHSVVNARNPAANAGLVQAAVEGHVLVKNTNNALPLKSPRLLSVYGYDAKPPNVNIPTAGLTSWSLGLQSTDLYAVLCGFSALFAPCRTFFPYAPNGTIVTGGGSGATTPAYISDPLSAIQARAMDSNIEVFWDTETVNSTSSVPGATDACLVFINAEASEGVDRPALYDSFSDKLVNNIANQCNNTIVVIHNAGVRLVDGFVNHPNVTGIIFAHLPGQDSGRALTQVLFGDVSPSGKLPYTVARNESDYGSILSHASASNGSQFALFPQDNFTEGVYIDYRAFDAKNITPRYEFGFGLTYTTFNYSNLVINKVAGSSNLSAYPSGAIVSGGHADLFDNVLIVSATITNTGSVAAAEIGQLYLSIPAAGQPVRQLRGFEKVYLAPGASATVTFPLQRRDLSVWDVVAQKWKLASGGRYTVSVGASSRTLPLVGTFTI